MSWKRSKRKPSKAASADASYTFSPITPPSRQRYSKARQPRSYCTALVVRIRALEMRTGSRFVISHVSGKRMIAQGTDGISRGAMNEGVMAGASMLGFIPLHLTAIQRQQNLRTWLEENLDTNLEWLDTEDWYQQGHDICSRRKPTKD